MPWPEIAKMLVLGVSAGILSGMFGIGGGLVIVPVLILLFGFDPKAAVGTSLFALLLPTGLLAAIEYWRRGEMKPLDGFLIAVGLFSGAYFGARLTGSLSVSTMKRAYAVFLIVVAIYFLWTSTPGQKTVPAAVSDAPEPGALDLDHDRDQSSEPVH
jgi:uncharacterized membrane protein YfcA